MKKKLLFTIFCASPMILTGCVDDNYDLSDIDTTSEIKINNLAIPVNLDPITLDNIFNLEEGDKIKKVTLNGETFYAVEQTGTFKSDPVRINSFEASPEPLSPSRTSLNLKNLLPARKKAPGINFSYELSAPVTKNFEYHASDIDDAIHSLDYIDIKDLTFTISISIDEHSSFNKIELNNLVVDVPKGLQIVKISPANATYNASTGKLTLSSLDVLNGKAAIAITTNGIDLKANDVFINYNNHTLNFKSNLNLNKMEASTQINLSEPPTKINLTVDYSLSHLEATSVTGMIQYSLEGKDLTIDPIELNDLPDFLKDKRTDLILYNPQIFLDITNPVGDANLNYRSGMQILAKRPGLPTTNITLDSFEVDHSLGYGPYNYCLSPIAPTNVPAEYANGLNHVAFVGLSDLLSGEGLPRTLDLKLLNPEIYLQQANRFRLGRSLEPMKGSYKFLAPLALKGDAESGSVIVYSEKKTGWFDDDLSDLLIQHLEINALVTSTIPFDATLTGSPLDGEGNVITYKDASGNIVPVTIQGAVIPGGATDHPVKIIIDGEIRDLDGINFEAVVRPDGSSKPLAPEQSLTLKQSKVRISGKYIKDF